MSRSGAQTRSNPQSYQGIVSTTIVRMCASRRGARSGGPHGPAPPMEEGGDPSSSESWRVSRRATATKRGSRSISTAPNPSATQAIPVLPLPAKGSTTRPRVGIAETHHQLVTFRPHVPSGPDHCHPVAVILTGRTRSILLGEQHGSDLSDPHVRTVAQVV